jgi:membrane fusion protein (multidrug efflux system)
LSRRPPWPRCPAVRPPSASWPATRQPITQSSEYIGRIQATNRVNLVARVSAYIDEVLFTEGTEVKKGDLLYRLEQAPFRADVQAKEAAVAQFKAQLQNASRARPRQALLQTPAGQQSSYDCRAPTSRRCRRRSSAPRRSSSRRASTSTTPRSARRSTARSAAPPSPPATIVSTGTGTLVSIVSQDPMYVVFPVPTRTVIELQRRSGGKVERLVIRIRCPTAACTTSRARSTSSTIR